MQLLRPNISPQFITDLSVVGAMWFNRQRALKDARAATRNVCDSIDLRYDPVMTPP